MDMRYDLRRVGIPHEEEDLDARDAVQLLIKEIERLNQYKKLVNFIANDYHELSYEKAQWQRDDWKKRCKALQQKDNKQ